MRRALAFLTAAVALGSGVALWAQGTPVLHEYVPPAGGGAGEESAYILDPTVSPEDEPGTGNPLAVKQGDRYLPAPDSDLTREEEEPLHGTPEAGARRDEEATLDRVTSMDGRLQYGEVYNPSIVPFKRMTALDRVAPGPRLVLGDPTMQPVPVGGDSRADRDLFWGSILLELSPGKEVAIPSVAPDMRILSYEAEPKLAVTFLRDAADNYYVRADDPTARGPHRIVFLVDAPATYFGAEVPSGLVVGQPALADRALPMPDDVRATGIALAGEIGVRRGDDLRRGLGRLIGYYRSFEAGEPPPGRDLYPALTRARIGVCRHRAFSFVVTANALGIPARYVRNEAHAFAEVWVPGPGWLRVDLGGAALELDVDNARDKAMHQPRAEDPFPKPTEYAENYSRLNGSVSGLTGTQREEGQMTAVEESSPDASSSTSASTPSTPTGLPRLRVSAGETGRSRTSIVVTQAEESGFRGDLLTVGGTVVSGGRGVGGLVVEIYLRPADGADEDARLVGHTVTGAAGDFSAKLRLPADLPLGEHQVFAATPGDARHDGALSR